MDDDGLAPLIARAKHGDGAAFDVLVDQYGPRLHGYLFRLTGSRDAADDLLGEVFVRLVRMICDYDHVGRFDGWIFRIATNLARDRVRRIRRGPSTVSLESAEAADRENGESLSSNGLADRNGPSPDAWLDVQEQVDRLQAALGRLPQAEREVILLRHFSDLSFAEIAETMETPLGTALARSHRGLAKLRSMLDGMQS